MPEVLAYAQDRKFMFCDRSLVVMEYAEDSFHPADVFSGEVQSAFSNQEILNKVGKLLLKMYYAGCNHIDTHAWAFLIHNNNEQKDKVIDFQFAVFHDRPKPNILSSHLSYFVRSIDTYLPPALLDEWTWELLSQVDNVDVDYQYQLYKKYLSEEIPESFKRMLLQ